jgi:hypothetical protein
MGQGSRGANCGGGGEGGKEEREEKKRRKGKKEEKGKDSMVFTMNLPIINKIRTFGSIVGSSALLLNWTIQAMWRSSSH